LKYLDIPALSRPAGRAPQHLKTHLFLRAPSSFARPTAFHAGHRIKSPRGAFQVPIEKTIIPPGRHRNKKFAKALNKN
jgi:hypothetical protein